MIGFPLASVLFGAVVLQPLLATRELQDRRPIITGCLAECGNTDQACVTDCQVCVEEHGCSELGKRGKACKTCFKQVKRFKQSAKHSLAISTDSGGDSLIRDGLRNHLIKARLDRLDERRLLVKARVAVLRAQRQAEWAEEERAGGLGRIRTAKAALKKAEAEMTHFRKKESHQLRNGGHSASGEQGRRLQSNVVMKSDDVDNAVRNLKAARGLERIYRERLEKAKNEYRTAAKASEATDRAVSRLERNHTDAMELNHRWTPNDADPEPTRAHAFSRYLSSAAVFVCLAAVAESIAAV